MSIFGGESSESKKTTTLSFPLILTKSLSFLRFSFTGGKLKSDSLLNFTVLPSIDESEERILAEKNEYLTGEHDKFIHTFAQTEEELDLNDLNHVISRGNKKRDLKEIHLVSYLVKKITEDSAIVPKKAFTLDFNNNLRIDENFASDRETCFSHEGFERFAEPSEEKVNTFESLRHEKDLKILEEVKERG